MNPANEPQTGAEIRQTIKKLKKPRSDSNWRGLTFEQCEQVERWLFEDNLGYEDIVARVKQEFGVETSRWSVARFFRQRARLRQSLELIEAQVASDELAAMPASTGDLRSATIKLLAKKGLRLATERPDDVKELLPVTKLLLASELNEIRLRRVKLEERGQDFKAKTACAGELVKVREYVKAVGDNEYLSKEEKQERVRQLLFSQGRVNPAGDPQGETP